MNDTQRNHIAEIKKQLKLYRAELLTIGDSEHDADAREALLDAADMLRDLDVCLRDAKSKPRETAVKNPAAVALGRIKSDKKAAAARANGAKGGRPRKVEVATTVLQRTG